jgi:hypothetical protein
MPVATFDQLNKFFRLIKRGPSIRELCDELERSKSPFSNREREIDVFKEEDVALTFSWDVYQHRGAIKFNLTYHRIAHGKHIAIIFTSPYPKGVLEHKFSAKNQKAESSNMPHERDGDKFESSIRWDEKFVGGLFFEGFANIEDEIIGVNKDGDSRRVKLRWVQVDQVGYCAGYDIEVGGGFLIELDAIEVEVEKRDSENEQETESRERRELELLERTMSWL